MLRWRRLCLCLLAGFVIVGSSGCSLFTGVRDFIAYNDVCNDFVTGWRNEIWAKQSWHENKACFADRVHLKHFGEGYQAGYRDVASGGDGCPPPLPPRCYWAWQYQTPEGQAKVAAWFAGFPHGAATAERDNAGGWSEIQVSHHVATQYSPEFQDGTIFLPDELMDQLNCDRPDDTLMSPELNEQNLPPLAPQADPAFQPPLGQGASAIGPRGDQSHGSHPVPAGPGIGEFRQSWPTGQGAGSREYLGSLMKRNSPPPTDLGQLVFNQDLAQVQQ